MLKNYSIMNERLNAYRRSYKFCFVLLAMFFAPSLMAQKPELVTDNAKDPKYLTEFDGKLFFNAEDADGKKWLWNTDGTTTSLLSGTVVQSHPGADPRYLTVFKNKLIFSSVLNEGSSYNRELFEFDGTGPSLIKNIQNGGTSDPKDFTEYNGSLYFSADNGYDGREPWVTDGTESGTNQFADIYFSSGDSNPFSYGSGTVTNGKIIFDAEDNTYGTELWEIDGTSNGTKLLKDINPGSSSSNPYSFFAVGNKVYFIAEDDSHGQEPWVTDGTTAGTYLLKDINTSSTNNSLISGFAEYDGKIYFGAYDETNGKELWVTDGTESGTTLFKNIYPSSGSSNPFDFIKYNGKLYFGTHDGTSYGIYVTDGTEAGSVMIKHTGDQPTHTIIYDGRLYFTADDGSNGRQLWVSDGTTSGTEVIAPDVATNDNPIPISYFEYAIVEGTLYYTADYDGSGLKLYKLTTNNLSVADNTKSEFVAFPNPVQDILRLETPANNIQKIDLFSITGQRLKSWEGKSEINITQFAPGSYFIKITTDGDRSVVKKILKK